MPKAKLNYREHSSDKKKAIVSYLVVRMKIEDGVPMLAPRAISDAAKNFKCHNSTISRTWATAKKNYLDPNVKAFRATPQKHKCGRKEKWDREALKEEMVELTQEDKGSLRCLAEALGIPKSTIHKMVRYDEEKIIEVHTSSLKPALTDLNMFTRFLFAAGHVLKVPESVNWKYDAMFSEVHIDEKWFYITKVKDRMYLAVGEPEPYRAVKHKSHIDKIMFIAAVARPRYNADGVCTFDGKIGLWPFIKKEVAQRGSCNRPAGTTVIKSIGVDKAAYKNMIFKKVLPAIRSKFPTNHQPKVAVKLQHDNAPAHFDEADSDWIKETTKPGRFRFLLKEQPPNSPDCNVLDLGFFACLQAAAWRIKRACNLEGLIANVETAFLELDPSSLNKTFITYQTCLDKIILHHGNNNYKIPHMNKDRLERENRLPVSVSVSMEAKEHLKTTGTLT